MTPRVRLLAQLISESLYVVDERAVADAMLARAAVRATVADSKISSQQHPVGVRSLRRDATRAPAG
jgi:hypothetical protein